MKSWSIAWKASTKPRKQRKYRYLAPTHIKKRFFSAHLSKELREKHNKRNMVVKTGDKVKVMRGQFKGHTGKVDKVDMKRMKVFVSGIELQKKDGSKLNLGVAPSNIMITELKIDDKKRSNILERKNGKKSP
ncbi:50S ribosomal protein L24 [Candidatus Woesearchaeota archaeon]|nr:50S ribosomal protein L24 [Candidatus Woesearchaeota archaeon]